MVSKSIIKLIGLSLVGAMLLIGCGEKDPEYKIEGPKASDMQEVAGVASSNGPVDNKDRGATNAPAPGELSGAKGKPNVPTRDAR